HRPDAALRIDDIVELTVERPQRHISETAASGVPCRPSVAGDGDGGRDMTAAVLPEVLPDPERAARKSGEVDPGWIDVVVVDGEVEEVVALIRGGAERRLDVVAVVLQLHRARTAPLGAVAR